MHLSDFGQTITDGVFVIENCDVADLFPMLPNIKELHFRFYDGLDLYFADYQQDYESLLTSTSKYPRSSRDPPALFANSPY
ncbi:hypothetical protein M378DRAFT_160441 [Amanita muscaria Koide BX008]|uniref:Uncharacterized protein n=1 Tax=Amanita muscaria (strain Koide BX008) TaxID=946122 RepID=A0A0C2TIU9_AMAMK|nr:hypothetical protein M378DRAFT_160441 [Amanita muscaria Koide BX008]